MTMIAHANFRATDPRPSRRNQSVTYGATSSANAAAIAAELQNWTTGQLTSVTYQVGGSGYSSAYPAGTRGTVNIIVSDSTYAVHRINVRNVTAPTTGLLTNAWTALMLGNAYLDAQFSITALSAPPILPRSGNPVAVVNRVSYVVKY